MTRTLQIDPLLLAAAGAVVVAGLLFWVMLRSQKKQAENNARLLQAQYEMVGQLQAVAANQANGVSTLNERLQAQERAVTKNLDDRLGEVRKHLGDNLTDLRERLAVIDTAQKNITELSGQMVELQDILSNKQARGAFGEVQLENLVQAALPPSAYSFQTPLENGCRVDCLLILPNPPGPIAIDAKFPLESYKAYQGARDEGERVAAGRAFSADVIKHVKDIQEKYIVPGETAESALMFLPSEAVYAELHASFGAVVEDSYRRRVWIVSPTTLMATLNTVRAVLKDARMREMAHVIQKQVQLMLRDTVNLDDRVTKLERNFNTAAGMIGEIRKSTQRITGRAVNIEKLELGEIEEGPVEELEPAKPTLELGN